MRQSLSCLFIAGALLLAAMPSCLKANEARAVAAQAAKETADEKRFGFLKSVTRTKDGWQIKINYASFFEGDEAERAAKEDGQPSPADGSGIYIRDLNPRLHTVTLTTGAQIFLLHDLEARRISIEQFSRVMRGETKGLPAFWGFPNYSKADEGLPCEVRLARGEVIKITQVYLP
jgi:hypothetical protein